MQMIINIIRHGMIPAFLFFLTAGPALTCSNPIFQFALEQWHPDPYRVVARGSSTWTAEQRAALRLLQDAERSGRANLRVRLEPAATNAAAPLMEVSYADARGIQSVIWTGTPDIGIAQRLLDSPARTKIASLLTQRKAAVWVLLESGNRHKDNAVARLLQDELRQLESVLTTTPSPEDGMGWGGGAQQASPPVSFGILRVRRDDPAEAMLVQMLLNIKPDLKKASDETLVFPIYGKGLILNALVGSTIEPQRIWAVAEFLTGPCSCVFKDSWHGASLLMNVDWGVIFKKTTPPAGGAPVGAGAFLQRMEQDEKKSVEPEPPPGKGKSKQ